MKKIILSIILFSFIFHSSSSYGYNMSDNDLKIANNAYTKIASIIEIKNSKKYSKENFITALAKLRDKKFSYNERLSAIINKTIDLLNGNPDSTNNDIVDNWKCGDSLTAGGYTYSTKVGLDGNCWTSTNMKHALTGIDTGKSWCYNNDYKNCNIDGRLYNWYAASDEKLCGALGKGWALPSDQQFINLSNVGATGWTGNKLGGIISSLPGKYFMDFNSGLEESKSIGQFGYWWTSTINENNPIKAKYHLLYKSDSLIGEDIEDYTINGFSVVCIYNNGEASANNVNQNTLVTPTINNPSSLDLIKKEEAENKKAYDINMIKLDILGLENDNSKIDRDIKFYEKSLITGNSNNDILNIKIQNNTTTYNNLISETEQAQESESMMNAYKNNSNGVYYTPDSHLNTNTSYSSRISSLIKERDYNEQLYKNAIQENNNNIELVKAGIEELKNKKQLNLIKIDSLNAKINLIK